MQKAAAFRDKKCNLEITVQPFFGFKEYQSNVTSLSLQFRLNVMY